MFPVSIAPYLPITGEKKGGIWVLRDEILHCVQNDKSGVGSLQATVKNGWLVLHCVQDDKGGLVYAIAAGATSALVALALRLACRKLLP